MGSSFVTALDVLKAAIPVSQVWRVCWNVLGTVLVSSGDDGSVRMWKGIF